MWLLLALGSSVFAALNSILAKMGLSNLKSNFATALRTCVVFIFGWIVAAVSSGFSQLANLNGHDLVFLILSGIATGISWLAYYHALQQGPVDQVVAIDKSSTILTILIAFLFLSEPVSWLKGIGTVLIGIGTFLTISLQKGDAKKGEGHSWLFWAVISAIAASATSILAKVGLQNIDSNLATAIRTTVVLIFAWIMTFVSDGKPNFGNVTKLDAIYLTLSGLATGMSWLMYYAALQQGQASVVVSIDKLSVVLTTILAWIIWKEKVSAKKIGGLVLLTAGTMLMIL